MFQGNEGGGKVRHFGGVLVFKVPKTGLFEFFEQQVGLFLRKGLGIRPDLLDETLAQIGGFPRPVDGDVVKRSGAEADAFAHVDDRSGVVLVMLLGHAASHQQ